MLEHDFPSQRPQGYSLASLLLLVSLFAAGFALLRSGATANSDLDSKVTIAAFVGLGLFGGGLIGVVVGVLRFGSRDGIAVGIFAGIAAGGFCGAVLALRIWFPMFVIGAIVVCLVALAIKLTRRPSTPPPPPRPAVPAVDPSAQATLLE